MEHLLETRPRRATNITLPAEIYEESKRLGINFSRTCEQALREVIRAERERQWAIEHAAFIKAHNQFVKKNGVPLAEHRMF
ncbi:MAG: type II toxin-antitoxin system CcdA family antitoxin [Burkholderiaceae bacterium]|jgi:antitoxin CcdA|nr:type II toxin-antitoxin system CcdA family antitoxin [Burkholderiaceae bacterium]